MAFSRGIHARPARFVANSILNAPSSRRSGPAPLPPRFLQTLVLLWLAGAGLRITVLAIPPVIPLIHQDLHLSQTDIGILSGLPPLLFACAAIPGAALIARFGALPILTGGLLVTAVAGALRGVSPDAMTLFATTFVMGAGIAVMQPTLPPIVRAWLPNRTSFATAVYSNGLLLGETFSASLTIPLILPMTGGNWRLSVAFWSLPVLLAVLLATLRMRRPVEPATVTIAARRWWPDWRNPLTWKLGLIMGSASGLYFGTNAFLPDYLTRSGRHDLVFGALSALNISQILATVVLLLWARHLTLKRAPYIVIGTLAAISVAGLIMMSGTWVLLWSGLIGFCCACTLTLTLSLPPILTEPHDVHRLSAAMFTIGYLCAVLIPVAGGLGWDLTAIPAMAFAPAGLCGIAIVALSATLNFGGSRPAEAI